MKTDKYKTLVNILGDFGYKDDETAKILGKEQKLKESETKKFSTVEKTKRGLTILVAYPDQTGVETEEGLNSWEAKDSANRRLNFGKDKVESESKLKYLIATL